MKNRIGKSLICIVLLCAIIVNLGSCITVGAVDLMDGVTPQSVTARDDLGYGNASVTDFALRLFLATEEGEEYLYLAYVGSLCSCYDGKRCERGNS